MNFEATHWSKLINQSQSRVWEPTLAENFSDNELLESLMCVFSL